MRSRRERKDDMSNDWSDWMSMLGGADEQSATVMAFAIVTIEVHIERVTVSGRDAFVITGRTEVRISREEVVAWRQGEMLLVTIGKEYLRTIGRERAVRADVRAPVM